MPKVDLYNVSGKVIGDIELKDEVFNLELDIQLLRLKGFIQDQNNSENDLQKAVENRYRFFSYGDAMLLT